MCNAVERVEVATYIHCHGVGAACSDSGDIRVAAVLYTSAIFLDVFPLHAAFSGSFSLRSFVLCIFR